MGLRARDRPVPPAERRGESAVACHIGRRPCHVPHQPDRRPAQVRHRPELRRVAEPGCSARPRSGRRTSARSTDRRGESGPARKVSNVNTSVNARRNRPGRRGIARRPSRRRESRRSGQPSWRASCVRGRRPWSTAITFIVSRSQRNPTPLFGLGLIDAIPDCGDREDRDRGGPDLAGDQGPPRPPQGRPYRPAGLEGTDRQYRGLRPECLRRRARPGGPRPPAGRGPAGPEISLARPRPERRRVRRAGRLRAELARSRRATAHRSATRRGTSRPAGRSSPASAARIATCPSSATSRGSTATCCSMTWAARWAMRDRTTPATPAMRPAAAESGERCRGRQSGRLRKPAPIARTQGRLQAGMADAAALGLPRLGPVPPRRPRPDPGAGGRDAWRPG